MIEVIRYRPSYHPHWDEFIAQSKNGHFLFYRNYMEYHADRFADYSLLFCDDHKLVAVLPANAKEDTLYSHGGLTFGGVISDNKMKIPLMLQLFACLREYLLEQGFKKMVYKAVPHIYHHLPAEEDLYALFFHRATLFRRDVSSTIFMPARLDFSKGRQSCIKKGQRNGLVVRQSSDFETFMSIDQAHLLRKCNKQPVHTAAEMRLLAGRFPENIKLFASYNRETMAGGVIVYENREVAHAQYIAATDEGKEAGALDVILDYLINSYYRAKKYFDFGISTDHAGQYLDVGLVANKESYGGRTTVYDFYELELAG